MKTEDDLFKFIQLGSRALNKILFFGPVTCSIFHITSVQWCLQLHNVYWNINRPKDFSIPFLTYPHLPLTDFISFSFSKDFQCFPSSLFVWATGLGQGNLSQSIPLSLKPFFFTPLFSWPNKEQTVNIVKLMNKYPSDQMPLITSQSSSQTFESLWNVS